MPTTPIFSRRCSRLRIILVQVALILLFFPSDATRSTIAAPARTPPSMWVTDGSVASTAVSGNTIFIGGGFRVVGPPSGGFGAVDQTTGRSALTMPNVDGIVYAMAEDGAGGWYIGGTFTHVGGLDRNNLAHIRADGTTDPDWNPNALTSSSNPFRVIWALAVSNGAVYLGGEFTSIGGQPRRYLAAVDVVTGALTSWDMQTNGQVWALVADGSTVYVGGPFDTIAGQTRNYLAALDTATSSVTSWDPKANGGIAALALYDKTLYVTGGFSNIGGQERYYIAALDTQTGTATSWDPNGNGSHLSLGFAFGLAVTESTVYVGGQFDGIGTKARQNIAAINRITGDVTDWNPGADGWVMGIAIRGNTVYANGLFGHSGGQPRYRVVALDARTGLATDWDPHVGWAWQQNDDQNADHNLPGVLRTSDTNVYIGGDFTTVGGVRRNNLAALDTTTGMVTDWDPNVDGYVRSILLHDSTLYVGGDFTHVRDQPRNRLAALDLSTDALTPWAPDVDNRVYTLAISDTTIYAGGEFTTIGGQPRNHIAAVDVTTGSATSWHPDADAAVSTLAISGTTVYAGGYFTNIGGQLRNHLGSLDGASNTATDWNPNPTSDTYAEVSTLAVSENTVYVGGTFTQIGGQQRGGLAAIDGTTGAVTSWKPASSATSTSNVSKLTVQGQALYLAGLIQIDDTVFASVAAVDRGTGAIIPWAASVSGGIFDDTKPGVLTIAVSGSTVYVGGFWKSVGTEVRSSFAAFPAVTAFVHTEAATNVTETSATLNGTVNAYTGSALVTFEYTTTSGDYRHAVTSSAVPGTVSGTSDTPVRADITGLVPGTMYYYRVVATGDGGGAVGEEQIFTTTEPAPTRVLPTIVSQPDSQVVTSGQSTTLTIVVSGTSPFTYQWYEGISGDISRPIAGATSSSFTTPPLSSTTSYWVRVTNAAGSGDSATATITVAAAPTRAFVVYVPLVRR